jgi:hypothetical protein
MMAQVVSISRATPRAATGTVEDAAMPIGPIHHGCNAKSVG